MTIQASHRRHSRASNTKSLARHGFTLVELLVVIGIILVLISILIPVVNRVQLAAQTSNTLAEMSNISSAITQYYADWHAYPGPISNDTIEVSGVPAGLPSGIGANANISGPENLVLGLLGGLNIGNIYTATDVGLGPVNLNGAANHQRHPPYMNVQGTTLLSGGKVFASDSLVPEFLDRYASPLPLLYLRARVGAPGVVSLRGLPGKYQYDLADISVYTSYTALLGSGQTHGLTSVGSSSGSVKSQFPADGYVYFQNPSLPGTARAVDQFILISAGKDGIYGNADDMTTAGDESQ